LEQANKILQAIVSGASDDLPIEIRRSSIVALLNALVFVKENFETKEDRDYIMMVIFSAAISADAKIQDIAFQCLVRVAEKYYEKLPDYIANCFGVRF